MEILDFIFNLRSFLKDVTDFIFEHLTTLLSVHLGHSGFFAALIFNFVLVGVTESMALIEIENLTNPFIESPIFLHYRKLKYIIMNQIQLHNLSLEYLLGEFGSYCYKQLACFGTMVMEQSQRSPVRVPRVATFFRNPVYGQLICYLDIKPRLKNKKKKSAITLF